MKKKFGYHCTNINPDFILANGFKATGKGFTDVNVIEDFYKKYLPKNPMFLSDLKAEVWSKNSKYCIKVDVTGLQLYPDFGHLLDYKAYYDDDCFYWSDNGLMQLKEKASKDIFSKKVFEFAKNLEDNTLLAKDFSGEMSRDLIGTFTIDGDLLVPERVIEIKTKY